jgi:hypothetical protein
VPIEPLAVAPVIDAEGAYVVPPQAAAVANETAVIASGIAAVPNGNPVVATVASDVAAAASDVASGKGISDFAASIIRTETPYLVSYALTILGDHAGIHIPGVYGPIADSGATLLLGTVYYVVVRGLEAKFPKLGWLLGVPRKPVYSA